MPRVIFFSILLLITACENRKWKNPYDPEANWAPSNLKIESIFESKIKLTWNNNSMIRVGFIIKRSINDSTFTEINRTNELSYFDEDISIENTYAYLIRAFTENNISDASNIKKIKWVEGPYILLWTGEHLSYSVNFSPDNSKVVSGGEDDKVKVWDVATGDLLWTGEHSDNVYSVNFSPDNSKVVSGGKDGKVKVWDTATGNLLWTGEHSHYVCSVNISPDNSKVVSGGLDGKVKVWDTATGNLLWAVKHSDDVYPSVYSVNFSPDNSKIVSGEGETKDDTASDGLIWIGRVKVWNSATGNLLWTGEHSNDNPRPYVNSVNFSLDNSKVVSGGDDGKVKVWDVATGNLLWTGEHPDDLYPYVYSVNFSPDNSKVVSGGGDDKVKVWDAATGDLLWKGEHSGIVQSVNFSPDNSKVASGGWEVKVWKSGSGGHWNVIDME